MCVAIITSVSHADVLTLWQEPEGILGSIRNEKSVQNSRKVSMEKRPAQEHMNVRDLLG